MSQGSPRRQVHLALKRVVSDISLFSHHVLGKPLRPYQLEPARAIVDSVLKGRGLTFTVMMSRQAGKNELSAQLEAYLLTLFQRRGGNIVKCAPTFKPQIINSKRRLEETLSSSAWHAGRWRGSYGYMVELGKAAVVFFSADESSNVVGATAHILLEVDEAQDVSEEKYSKDFRPMGATTNVTTVLYGTAWTPDTLLERQKRVNLELEARDGVRRHFQYPWETVAEHSPDYRRYVEGEIARLGETHPLIRTQYLLESIEGQARFLSATQLALLQGEHTRLTKPRAGKSYVASVDVAGEDEEAHDAALRALKPRKDSTVVTVAEVEAAPMEVGAPLQEMRMKVVQHYWWTGRRHRDLFPELVTLLRDLWKCRAVVVDATGIGAGVASFLVAALGERVVTPFVFTAPSKSELAYGLLGAINSGRVQMYADDGSEEYREFWHQAQAADYSVGANQAMSFYVPPERGHDDFLVGLALLAHAGGLVKVRRAAGRIRWPWP